MDNESVNALFSNRIHSRRPWRNVTQGSDRSDVFVSDNNNPLEPYEVCKEVLLAVHTTGTDEKYNNVIISKHVKQEQVADEVNPDVILCNLSQVSTRNSLSSIAPGYHYTSYFNSKQFSDVTIVVGNRQIAAHKLVLAYHSPVFEGIFRHDTGEKRVKINDIDYETMLNLIHFMYAGKLMQDFWNEHRDVVFEEYVKLLRADNRLCVKNFKALCENRLILQLSRRNVVESLIVSDSLNALEWKQAALDYFAQEVKDLPEIMWKKLAKSHSSLWLEILKALLSVDRGC